jgi:hypothetical protein
MSWKSILISFVFSFLALNTLGSYESKEPNLKNSDLNYSYGNPVITYGKVFFNGIWWIIVYADGIKIDEYPDPDQ